MIPIERIKEISSARGEKNALVFEEEKVIWSDLYKIVSCLTKNISQKIDTKSDLSMCYISPNCLELIYLISSAASLKIPCTGIDYTQESPKIESMIRSANCKLLVVSSSYCMSNNIDLRKISEMTTIIDIDNNLTNNITYDELIKDCDIDNVQAPHRAFKSISFTSGTSGVPKAVIRNKSFDGRRFSFFTARYGFSSEDKHLLAMPLYHAAGSGWARLFMQLGATMIIASPHDTKQMAQLIRSEWITTSAMTPPLLKEILQHYANQSAAIRDNNLKFIIVGGKHFHPQAKVQAINALGPVVYEYYGTTETGVNALAEPSDIISNPRSVGRAYDGNDILILDENHNTVSHNNIGRIAISSYMNMDGYDNQDSESVIIDDIKYLITAETGYMDMASNLYLMNRTQGESRLNVYELENEINHLPGIKDVAIIPAGRNSVYCGFVLEEESFIGTTDFTRNIKEIGKQAKVKIQKAAQVDKIPYSPSGKVKNHELKQLILNERGDVVEERELSSPKKSKNNLASYLIAIACLLGTVLSWGAMFPIAKNALHSMDAVHISLIRYGSASIILLFLLGMKEGIRSFITDRKDFYKLWLFGSFGFAGFSILAFAGLAHTKAQHGAIIMALMPLISVILMWYLKKIKPNNFTLISIVFALFGVVLVITKGDASALSGGSLAPSLVILSGAFCWVTYTLGTTYVKGYSTLRYTALSSILGAFTIFIISLITNSLNITHAPNWEQVLGVKWELIYLITFAGVLAVFSWNYGISTLGPINGVLFINLVPITAFSIGVLQGESISHAEMFGTATAIVALILNNLYSRWSLMNKKVTVSNQART